MWEFAIGLRLYRVVVERVSAIEFSNLYLDNGNDQAVRESKFYFARLLPLPAGENYHVGLAGPQVVQGFRVPFSHRFRTTGI